MPLLGALIVVLGFLGLAKALGLLERNFRVIAVTRSALSVIGDRSLDDLQKETALQQKARELLVLFFSIIGISLIALGVPLGAVWALDALNLLSFQAVIATLTSAWFILAGVGVSLLYFLLKRGQGKESQEHTPLERTLHGLAFESWFPRVPLSRLESQLYRKQFSGIAIERPVFITALPRAGTTLALELSLTVNEFATHTYGDMPFLLTPLLWERFSRNYRDSGALSERVHGDGILVNAESPESFEEILWKEFWPSYYQADRILPWSDARYPAFEAFFKDHMRKIISLRSQQGKRTRYISKNNLNIARVAYLKEVFPDATILVLFRTPLQQASSLLKQHRNFLRIHQEDSFAREYMADTGHYDFGQNLRPVDFKGWLGKESGFDPDTLTFWLKYWIKAYRYLLNRQNTQVQFYPFDDLCQHPRRGLERLGQILAVSQVDPLLDKVDRIRQPKLHPVDRDALSSKVLEQAEDVYHELQRVSST